MSESNETSHYNEADFGVIHFETEERRTAEQKSTTFFKRVYFLSIVSKSGRAKK